MFALSKGIQLRVIETKNKMFGCSPQKPHNVDNKITPKVETIFLTENGSFWVI